MTQRNATAAVVLAAGKGTRMRSELPKVLHPLLGRPLLAHAISPLIALKISPIVVVIGFGGEQVRDALGGDHSGLAFATQEAQLGTGHATNQARLALESFDGDILILPGDVPLIKTSTLQTLLDYHREQAATLTVLTTRLEHPAHYGRIVRDTHNAIERIVEAKDATPDELALQEINSGIYLVDARFLFSALARVRNDNAQSEYYLTDIVELARRAGLNPRAFLHPDSDELAGINDRLELAAAGARLQQTINRAWMVKGVTLTDPSTIRIEPDVTLEPDVCLEAGVQLRGHTRIGRGCHLEPGVIVSDSVLEPNVKIGAYSVLEKARIATETELPPFSQRKTT